MKNIFDGASQKASDPPIAIGAEKTQLVLVSDCHGTLVSPVNRPLFQTLIKLREEGHLVIITSSRHNLETVTELMLKQAGKPENFFNVEVNGRSHAVVLKPNLEQVLGNLGVEKVDFVFDDEDPTTYLPTIKICGHVDPQDFNADAVPSGDFLRLRMAMAPSGP